MRRGPWKLHIVSGPKQPERLQLFQVETDIAERFDVAAAHPDIVTRMHDAMRAYEASFAPAPVQK